MMHVQQSRLDAYAFQRAKEGNAYCGDSFYMTATDDYFICVMADGLGSGEFAYESSNAVISVVEANAEEDVETLMDFSNKVLLNKRGAAVAVLKADFRNHTFTYSCVGNIRFYLYEPSGKLVYPLPVPGYLSGRRQKFKIQSYSYGSGSTFLMHSDGFVNKDTKPLLNNHPDNLSYLAKNLQEKQLNKSDDVTFIVGNLL